MLAASWEAGRRNGNQYLIPRENRKKTKKGKNLKKKGKSLEIFFSVELSFPVLFELNFIFSYLHSNHNNFKIDETIGFNE